MAKILVAGSGNKYQGDDGFGPHAVEALQREALPGTVEVRDVGMCGVTLATDLGDYDLVIFIDAVQKGGKPGTIYKTEIKAEEVEALRSDEEKHAFIYDIREASLEDLLVYARAIGTLPPTIMVFGCEIQEITMSEKMTPPVAAAVPKVVDLVRKVLERHCVGH
ncbi:MAG TPA: hydrogenase maturation protease [Methanomicrobia archaeon]|nr:hydrogenase maturation protease [Methanomicrobia archaeon]